MNVVCKKCGTSMVLRKGRYGEFYACPRSSKEDPHKSISKAHVKTSKQDEVIQPK
jgi:ssDNA-binding Zn-finger/Zn-ribbon topoisomerase 1